MQTSPPPLDLPALAWIGAHPWAYPALEALHIVGIGVLLGSLLMFELRLWGLGRELPLAALARLALPVSLAGFALAAAAGLLMFASQPSELVANRYFVWKMGLLFIAGCNAAAFHARGGLARPDGWARAQTALSLGLWIAVIICGRWIAYA
ncbi:hypothetical protein [Caldimonas tepidiphila]|uniref:hypothetical protein n=1 Tax=Caldimonas tepidiphila TaxID=2315841 RepID=UPI000E5C11D7|nr:hypothetical protein [Caldimonas tepidiphila]